MGDVAAAATGDADFGEKTWAAFQDCHLDIGGGLRTSDRSKKTRRSAADDHHPPRTHSRKNNDSRQESRTAKIRSVAKKITRRST
jgi:hypothetical protein